MLNLNEVMEAWGAKNIPCKNRENWDECPLVYQSKFWTEKVTEALLATMEGGEGQEGGVEKGRGGGSRRGKKRQPRRRLPPPSPLTPSRHSPRPSLPRSTSGRASQS